MLHRPGGRAGTTSPNIQVTPVADPSTGLSRYTQIIDRDTGTIKYIDNGTGQEVPADQVQIQPPEDIDPLDNFLDSMFNEIFTEIDIGL